MSFPPLVHLITFHLFVVLFTKEDAPSQKAKKRAEEEENRPVNIRVMEVMFFANNTFATVGGLGEATVLRGKYHIIGNDRDQLWMQVWRFGFGRSVSGSVFR